MSSWYTPKDQCVVDILGVVYSVASNDGRGSLTVKKGRTHASSGSPGLFTGLLSWSAELFGVDGQLHFKYRCIERPQLRE